MTTILNWINSNPEWSGVVIFLLCYLECLFLLGVLIPGVVLLFAAAALVGSTDALPLIWMLIIAAVGGILGDLTGYFMGLKSSHRIHKAGWMKRHQNWIDSAEQFFNRWGALSVIIGRFVGPIRPFTPFLAGTFGMPAHKFFGFSVIASIGWAPVYLLPGYITGVSVDAMSGSAFYFTSPATEPFLWMGALAIGSIVLFAICNYQLQPSHKWFNKLQPLAERLKADELPIPSFFLTITSLIGFIWLYLARPLDLDETFAQGAVLLREPISYTLAVILTMMGDQKILVIMAFTAIVGFAITGYKRAAWHVLAALVLAQVSIHGLKFLLAVPRPEIALAPPSSFAFPSGHSGAIVVFLGLLAAFSNEKVSKERRWILYSVVSIPAVLVSSSRIYLGVHWFSDVLAGLCLGLFICGLIRVSYTFSRTRRLELKAAHSVLAVWMAMILMCYIFVGLDHALWKYQLAVL